jgi:HK97 family phage major capsid protein
MPNAVLARLLEQRDEQIAFVDQLLERVATDDRDLVDAEQSNLTSARQRIDTLDAQIEPLAAFENTRSSAAETQARALGRPGPAVTRQAGGQPAEPTYGTAGAFLVDYLRATGRMAGRDGRRPPPDPDAAARIERAVQNQTTVDTPGLLPVSIIGQVLNDIDASRPLMTSLGVRALGGIPGLKFQRPVITQHAQVGKQVGEKTEVASRKMIVGSVEFTKDTYAGSVDISRQDIDWSSPAAWDILIRDLQDVYAVTTNTAVATAFAAGITQSATAATAELGDILKALYDAAGQAYAGTGKMVDRIWVSLDMWGALGSAVDINRVLMPPAGQSGGTLGTSNLSSFAGTVLDLPRIVEPALPAGTLIVGWSGGFEVYEERIGLLSAVEPSLLGVEVAYGGYLAAGFMDPTAFAKVTVPVLP